MFYLTVKDPVYQVLDDAYRWYEGQLPGLGERLLAEIDLCFEKLKVTPFYYSIYEENYRQVILKHFPYKIIFEMLDEEVVIYAVFHTSRNPGNMFD